MLASVVSLVMSLGSLVVGFASSPASGAERPLGARLAADSTCVGRSLTPQVELVPDPWPPDSATVVAVARRVIHGDRVSVQMPMIARAIQYAATEIVADVASAGGPRVLVSCGSGVIRLQKGKPVRVLSLYTATPR